MLAAGAEPLPPRETVAEPGAPMPRVTDLLGDEGLIEREPKADADAPVNDLTREPLDFPADRDLRLQALARGDEGFLLALGYSTQRGYGRTHPFVGEIRFGTAEVEFVPEELGFAVPSAPSKSPSARWSRSPRLVRGAAAVHARLWPRLRPERAEGHVDGPRRSQLARPASLARRSATRRRTRNSCCPIATTSRRPASSST